MPTWTGWIQDFLAAAGFPNTADNRKFLADWAAHSNTNCRDNPIDLSHPLPGSTNCASLPGTSHHAQNYTSHNQAANAFRTQVVAGDYPSLFEALLAGHPYKLSSAGNVAIDLSHWGSGIFEVVYYKETVGAAQSGGGGTHVRAPHALGGWHDVQHSVSVKLPAALRQSNRHTVRALQALARARRVRL